MAALSDTTVGVLPAPSLGRASNGGNDAEAISLRPGWARPGAKPGALPPGLLSPGRTQPQASFLDGSPATNNILGSPPGLGSTSRELRSSFDAGVSKAPEGAASDTTNDNAANEILPTISPDMKQHHLAEQLHGPWRASVPGSSGSPTPATPAAAFPPRHAHTSLFASSSTPNADPSAPATADQGSLRDTACLPNPTSGSHGHLPFLSGGFGSLSGGSVGGGVAAAPGGTGTAVPAGSPTGSGRTSPAATGTSGGHVSDGGGSDGGLVFDLNASSPFRQARAAAPVVPPSGGGLFNPRPLPQQQQQQHPLLSSSGVSGASAGGRSAAGAFGAPLDPTLSALLAASVSAGAGGGSRSVGPASGASGHHSGSGLAGLALRRATVSGAGDGGGSAPTFLVVDPATGNVVGTAQATGTSTPGSLAACTPGSLSFNGTTLSAGGGHTPVASSGRSSFEVPVSPLSSHGPAAANLAGLAARLGLPMSGREDNGSVSAEDRNSTMELARATLSLLSPTSSSHGGGGGDGVGRGTAAVPPAAAGDAQQPSLAARLAAILAATESAAGGGAAVAPPSVESLMMMLAATAGQAGQQEQEQQRQRQQELQQKQQQGDPAAVAFARTMEPAVAAQMLQEGLAANCLDADVAVALAQAAGLIPSTSTDTPSPAAAAMASVAPSTAPSAAALINAATFAATAPPYPTAGSRTGSGSGPRLQSTLPPPSSPLLAIPPSSPANVFATGLPGVSTASLSGLFPDSLSPSPATHFPVGPGSARRTESAVTPGTWQASAMGGPPGLASPGMGMGLGGAASPVPAQGLLAALGSPRPGLGALGPKYNSLYKTEMCRSWQETGSCRYGSKCQFAHGPEELRPAVRHPKYKTELCRTYATTGACHYGNRCRFIHAMPPSVGVGAAGALSFSDMPHTSHRDFVFPDVGLQGPGAPGPAHGRASLDEAALRGGGAVGEPEDLAAAGGGQQLQRATEAAAAMLWSPAREPHGVQGLPAAAASLLSPTRPTSLLSPTNRGTGRHSLSMASPPPKMQRTAAQPGGGASTALFSAGLSSALAAGARGEGGGAGPLPLRGSGGSEGGSSGSGSGSGADAAALLFSAFGSRAGGGVASAGNSQKQEVVDRMQVEQVKEGEVGQKVVASKDDEMEEGEIAHDA